MRVCVCGCHLLAVGAVDVLLVLDDWEKAEEGWGELLQWVGVRVAGCGCALRSASLRLFGVGRPGLSVLRFE